MVRIRIFGIEKCGKCHKVKGRVGNLIRRNGFNDEVEVAYFDQNTFEGRAEGAWYDVDDKLPVTIIEKEERSIARWDGQVPKSDEIKLCLETAAGG
jgi:hypothetical protein